MWRASFTCSSLCLIAALLPGCGDDDDDAGDEPVDLAGTYSINVTSRENPCELENWMPGESATNIPFEVTQAGTDVQGTIGGVVGVFFSLVIGSAEFNGSVDGSSFEMTNYGTTSPVVDGCSSTWNVIIDGRLNADSISGKITYERSPNDNPDCAHLACENVQDFSGSRPPK